MSADLDQAIARLDWVEAMQQVQYTLNRATRALDYGPPEDWADCFTQDGVYAGERTCAGADELTGFAAASCRAAALRRHWIMAPDIEIQGATAQVTSLMGAFDATAKDGLNVSLMGRFVDAFVRCPDGRWRIARREAQVLAGEP